MVFTSETVSEQNYKKAEIMVAKSIAERMKRVERYRARKSLSGEVEITISLNNNRWLSKFLDLRGRWIRGFKATHTIKTENTHDSITKQHADLY